MFLLYILPLIIIVAGVYLHVCLGFSFVLRPFCVIQKIRSSIKCKGASRSLSLSLAGTLGVGNIIGVAIGILAGGAGSVLWLLVSSFFSVILKYAEAALSSDMGDGGHGGLMYIIKHSFCKCGGVLSKTYAFLCMLLAFFMGAAFQTSSAVECIKEIEPSLYIPLALLFVFAVAFVVFKGASSIERVVSVVIPISSLVYICLCITAIFINLNEIPHVVSTICSSAFDFKSIGGGVLGFFTSSKIREGFLRGMLSNEAGAGTSSLAHARNPSGDPSAVGIMGAVEVIFDTVVLCTLTAIAILVCVADTDKYESGVALILDSVGAVFGALSEYIIVLLIFIFAFSTVICWYYYGSECYRFLFDNKKSRIYYVAFVLSVCLGSVASLEPFVTISDYIFLFLTALCVLAIIKNTDRLVRLSERGGLIKRRR